MRWYHSIRWRLQLWHGLLLVLVLAGFGFTAEQLLRVNQLNRIDRALEQRIGIVEKPFRSADAPTPRRLRPGGFLPEESPRDDRPPPSRPLLSPGDVRIIEGSPDRSFYYTVWFRNGRLAAGSPFAPSDIPLPEDIPGPPSFRSRGRLRECFHTASGGARVLVGCDIGGDLAGIHRVGWLLAGTGAIVFIVGLAVGGWISTSALRPIGQISAAAAKIASGDLAHRIHTTGTRSELGRLAHDLNDTFARLEASFSRQAQFTADASHELRTPVTVVLTQTQSALTRERSPAEYRECLAACQRAAQRMRGLIEGLLTLARLDAGKAAEVAAANESCALDQIAHEAANLLGSLAEQQGVGLELELTPVRCVGNPDQLAQVVFNLIGNAIQYNRPGGTVRVVVGGEDDSAILSICDTGQGIAPDDLPHVFERFYRADKSRSGAQGHSGLGLAIVKAIVEAHGGKITVTSKVGEGSVFVVRVPGRLP